VVSGQPGLAWAIFGADLRFRSTADAPLQGLPRRTTAAAITQRKGAQNGAPARGAEVVKGVVVLFVKFLGLQRGAGGRGQRRRPSRAHGRARPWGQERAEQPSGPSMCKAVRRSQRPQRQQQPQSPCNHILVVQGCRLVFPIPRV
jgi:hypothetical protein